MSSRKAKSEIRILHPVMLQMWTGCQEKDTYCVSGFKNNHTLVFHWTSDIKNKECWNMALYIPLVVSPPTPPPMTSKQRWEHALLMKTNILTAWVLLLVTSISASQETWSKVQANKYSFFFLLASFPLFLHFLKKQWYIHNIKKNIHSDYTRYFSLMPE